MSEPFFTINQRVFNAASMDASLLNAPAIEVAEVGGFCIHAIWSGVPVGNISTQGSNDGLNFVEIYSQPTGGIAGQLLFNVEKQHYKFVRIQYIRISDSGTLDCYLSGKRL